MTCFANLSFGFLPSKSTKISDEIDPSFPKRIAEGAILKGKEDQDRRKIVDSERVNPKTQVNNLLSNALSIEIYVKKSVI